MTSKRLAIMAEAVPGDTPIAERNPVGSSNEPAQTNKIAAHRAVQRRLRPAKLSQKAEIA
jgi:hypothetical protein